MWWTEATFLVWKLRYERVIQNEGKDFSSAEVEGRWYATMNRRITLDRRTAALRPCKKGLTPREVQAIWNPVLADADQLPYDWVLNGGVLVGIR